MVGPSQKKKHPKKKKPLLKRLFYYDEVKSLKTWYEVTS